MYIEFLWEKNEYCSNNTWYNKLNVFDWFKANQNITSILIGILALVAQWIEQKTSNLLAVGSIPTEGTISMVAVAQLVRASGCGSEGRGFKSHQSPHYNFSEL